MGIQRHLQSLFLFLVDIIMCGIHPKNSSSSNKNSSCPRWHCQFPPSFGRWFIRFLPNISPTLETQSTTSTNAKRGSIIKILMWKRFTENLNFHSFENRLNYLQITEHRTRIIIVNLCWSRENLNRAEQTSTYSTEIDSQQRSRAGWNFVHSLFCFVKRTIITTRIGFLISICCYCWWCCCCLPRIVFCFTSACTNTLRSWKKSIQSRKLLTLRHQPETRSRENILKTSSIWRFSRSRRCVILFAIPLWVLTCESLGEWKSQKHICIYDEALWTPFKCGNGY